MNERRLLAEHERRGREAEAQRTRVDFTRMVGPDDCTCLSYYQQDPHCRWHHP